MAKKKYKELTILRRLITIQEINDAIKEKRNVAKYNNIDKLTYLLWKEPYTRNSDIWLAIRFYKTFYPEYIHDNSIQLDDFFKIPKMYDIQRTRAEIQNTEGLFPSTDEVRKKRAKREEEFYEYYKDKKRKTLKVFPDYYLYLDESGKNEKYFVVAGLLLNGDANNNSEYSRFNSIKKTLNEKYNLSINEFKFAEIKQRNLKYYKQLVDTIAKEGIAANFVSIIIENKGLTQKSEKNKTKELLEILLKDNLSSIIVRAACNSPYISSNKAKINITLDKDGNGFDLIEREKLKQNLETELAKQYKYLLELENLEDVDSKNNVLVQLADLYASSINYVFSEVKVESETAKCKKEFAEYLLKTVGFENITDEIKRGKNNISFINKLITSTENNTKKSKQN